MLYFGGRAQLYRYDVYRLIFFVALMAVCAVPAIARLCQYYQYVDGGLR